MKRHKKVNQGSVSTATLRTEDLLSTFLWELKQQRPLRREHQRLVSRIESAIESQGAYEATEEAIEDVSDLEDALDDYAPEYFYFGSHPGNGADFGYWLSEEWEQSLDEDGGIKVNDLADMPRDHYGLVAVVNDHGNVTLYRRSRNGRVVKLWSLV